MQILFLGPPGSGKGTQSKKLSEKTALIHLSSGDLLRQAVAEKTEAGQQAKAYIDAGQLVPDPILFAMFNEKLSQPVCQEGFILDGFPRNLNQAKGLDDLLAKLKLPLNSVLNLQIDDTLLIERMTGRRSCVKANCGAVYHLKFSPPAKSGVCDRCGGELRQRSDDQIEPFKKRLAVYHEATEPLIDYYDAKLLLRTIDGQGDAEDVFADILRTLEDAVKGASLRS